MVLIIFYVHVVFLSLSSKLQAVLLQQQSFLQKCEAWMDFLSQTEQKLAAEISGNYKSLLEQQRDHEAWSIKSTCALIAVFVCTVLLLI